MEKVCGVKLKVGNISSPPLPLSLALALFFFRWVFWFCFLVTVS